MKSNIFTKLLSILLLCLLGTAALAEAPATYYNSVDSTNAQALRLTIHNTIDDHTKFPYSSSRDTDTWDIIESADQDQNNANNVLTVYRNRSHAKTDHWSSGNPTGWNREHVWPKSYGFTNNNDRCNYPYTDVHHLFAANGDYNSARSNLMFNYVISVHSEYPVDNKAESNYCWNCDQYQDGDWEVWSERRGDVARALFYMDVRYEGDVNGNDGCSEHQLILVNDRNLIDWNSNTNFSPAHMAFIDTLLQWHAEDPPDAREILRNDIVFSYQGNRNPFIDHPEWVDGIWNSGGSGGSCVASSMHIDSIIPSSTDVGKGQKLGAADVSIIDDCGLAVANVSVTGTFTGGVSGTSSADSDNAGVARLESATSTGGKLSFDFCVDSASHASLTYQSANNLETCDSL